MLLKKLCVEHKILLFVSIDIELDFTNVKFYFYTYRIKYKTCQPSVLWSRLKLFKSSKELTVVNGIRTENLVAKLSADVHTILSGVPEKLGGHDEGMDPHELLEAALAACTIITVQMYANCKQWPLQSTNVQVKVESEGKESKISRKISFVGELTPEQSEKLLEIANKCPIHNLLESTVHIETSLS